MELLVKIVEHFKMLPDHQEKLMIDSTDNKEILQLVEAQIDNQMEEGKLSDNTEITPPYHPLTVELKALVGQPYDRVILKNTGKFRSEIFAKVDSEGIKTGSTDEKTEKLKYGWTTKSGRKHPGYGAEIFGITNENKQVLIQELLPHARNWALGYAKSIIQ